MGNFVDDKIFHTILPFERLVVVLFSVFRSWMKKPAPLLKIITLELYASSLVISNGAFLFVLRHL